MSKVMFSLFIYAVLFSVSDMPKTVSAQDIPDLEAANVTRLTIPDPNLPLNVADFPRIISPLDVALTQGPHLIHFTGGQLLPASVGPNMVNLVIEGYIANYSNNSQNFYDGDFLLDDGQSGMLPNVDYMQELKSGLYAQRDYPGRNVPFITHLVVNGLSVRPIFLAYLVPINTATLTLKISYASNVHQSMKILAIPSSNSNRFEMFKLELNGIKQYVILEPEFGESTKGAISDIVNPQRLENCTHELISQEYQTYQSSGYQYLRDFELTIDPSLTVSGSLPGAAQFMGIFAQFVLRAQVKAKLFELNYRELETIQELISAGQKTMVQVDALTAMTYYVRQQEMLRSATFRVQFGAEVITFPYVIRYSSGLTQLIEEQLETSECNP